MRKDKFRALEEEMQLSENPIAGGCNMTHVIEVEQKKDGYFVGKMKKVFKKFKLKPKKMPKSAE